MATNPLQQYFRQPKIFVGLPSGGIYNKPNAIEGDVSHIPIFGMTGMDEILLKTPDALMTGESTARLIASCCPTIKDPWDISSLDTELLFSAIRIATYGNTLQVAHICPHCNADNQYEIDLTTIVDHFGKCKYNNKLQVDKFKIITKPLNYKQMTDISVATFGLQQKLYQATQLPSEQEQKDVLKVLFEEINRVQLELYHNSVESVEVDDIVVNDANHIKEWLANCDKIVIDKIKDHIDKNKEEWKIPEYPVVCESCKKESKTFIDLDQSNFFVTA